MEAKVTEERTKWCRTNMVLLWWIDGNPVHFLDGGWNGSK
jgi:hypothetical protein